ncbi:L-2-hydroxyglutarate oxidase [Oceanicoccus sagamiensis]|uniref:Hydroxyglutarate oxidase n=1 Tax=Oceanicoccus sagamiensis TaxID=716816 RepID=A0A1X9NFM0_9GAMM|nr:L-2-hydroxyglutarate oxidase [Oceanicoccus sagamiensis]ARN73747.1 hydroxyglutarate oxidase [Oceanicoccus sagamiensis]
MPNTLYDYTIIGGGIVGVSVAWQLKQRLPHASILLIDKESQLAQHQTGHNSGVIHAGVYYAPGSLKAELCKKGAAATLAFCRQYGIAVKQPGKLLVACNALELQRMQALQQRCQKNGIGVTALNQQQLKQQEPNITGLGALLVEDSGIVDYSQITKTMARLFQQQGGHVQLNTQLQAAVENRDNISLTTNRGAITSRYVIACAGLAADRVARLLNLAIDFSIVPFRGEYYQLSPENHDLIQRLIYPIPDPALPFLGVHLTPMINGGISVGPNAVLGWKREGYGRINFKLKDAIDMLRFPGFWKLCRSQYQSGISEYKNSLYKRGYLKQIQKYCPQLTLQDLEPYPSGIRAQAVLADGSLVQDFLFAESARSLHVCNAPSPAATSAIPIGDYICQRLQEKTSV